MKLTTYDPKKGKYVFGGVFENKVYTREVTSAHFMRKFQAYAIQEDIIEQLKKLDCQKVVFKTITGILESNFSDWLLPNIKVLDYGHGKQRFLPIRYCNTNYKVL